jgi:hypothetical protein
MATIWTPEKIEHIPVIYRAFILNLKPIIDTREKVLQIRAVHLSDIFSKLKLRYGYEPQQVHTLAESLENTDLVESDKCRERQVRFLPTDRRGRGADCGHRIVASRWAAHGPRSAGTV